MKTIRLIIILRLLIFPFDYCLSQNSNFGINNSYVIITGKVQNFTNNIDQQTIQIICRDFFERQIDYTTKINKDGHFSIRFPSAFPQEFYLKYKALVRIFCNPGDSLYIEIDKYPNGKYFCKFPDKELGKTNQQITKFMEGLPKEKYVYNKWNEAEKNKSPYEFKDFIQARDHEYGAYLENFYYENNPTQQFRKWVSDHLKYESLNDLMRYSWTHPNHNNIDINNFQLPEDYFSFLKYYNMNDNEMFSIAHFDFLHELSIYSSRNPRDSLVKLMAVYKVKKLDRLGEIMINMIMENSTGFTRDLLITEFYVNLLKAQDKDTFKASYKSSRVNEPYFQNIIINESNALKKFLSNKNTNGVNIVALKSSITSDLINTISTKYKNKVIYIDFWAPWCSPCMEEMPFSKEIQAHFQNKDVIFLFLANRCKDDSWKATIANKKLTGEHMLLTDDQFNVLSSNLGIGGIPHYSLIDKKGIIVMNNAPRPSEKDKLIDEIENLLKK